MNIATLIEKYEDMIDPVVTDAEKELKIIYKLMEDFPHLELISGDEWPPEWPLGGDFGEEHHPHVGFIRVGGEQFWIIDRESVEFSLGSKKHE